MLVEGAELREAMAGYHGSRSRCPNFWTLPARTAAPGPLRSSWSPHVPRGRPCRRGREGAAPGPAQPRQPLSRGSRSGVAAWAAGPPARRHGEKAGGLCPLRGAVSGVPAVQKGGCFLKELPTLQKQNLYRIARVHQI